MPAWEVNAARERPCCGRRDYRVLGTIIAESFHEALAKMEAAEWELADDESLCIHIEPKPVSVWLLLRQPQI